MSEVVWRIDTPQQMRALARSVIAPQLRAGDVVILSGGLGAGKTTFTQGLAEALDVRGPVTSPTFIIARAHPPLSGGMGLIHVDAYRLTSLAELDDLDLDESVATSVTVVEWGEGKAEALAADRLHIMIDRDSGADTGAGAADTVTPDGPRVVTATGHGPRWTPVTWPSLEGVW